MDHTGGKMPDLPETLQQTDRLTDHSCVFQEIVNHRGALSVSLDQEQLDMFQSGLEVVRWEIL